MHWLWNVPMFDPDRILYTSVTCTRQILHIVSYSTCQYPTCNCCCFHYGLHKTVHRSSSARFEQTMTRRRRPVHWGCCRDCCCRNSPGNPRKHSAPTSPVCGLDSRRQRRAAASWSFSCLQTNMSQYRKPAAKLLSCWNFPQCIRDVTCSCLWLIMGCRCLVLCAFVCHCQWLLYVKDEVSGVLLFCGKKTIWFQRSLQYGPELNTSCHSVVICIVG